MSRDRVGELRALEGRAVTLALANGRRIDGASLMSAARGCDTVWVYLRGGGDHFVPVTDIVDFFETA